MDNYITIQNDLAISKRKKNLIVSLVVVLFIIVIAGVILVRLLTAEHKNAIRVLNYDSIDYNIPSEAREDLGAQVYYQLRRYFEVPEDASKITAIIRPETFKNLESGEIETVGFVLDIDDYKQSYAIKLSWSDKITIPETVSIECVASVESNYQNEKCYGMTTTSDSIKLYLPYEIELLSDKKVELQYGLTMADGKEVVEINVNSCGDKSVEDEALGLTKSWVKSLGLDPDSLYYDLVSKYQDCVIQKGG